jgi:hypothetical protein
VGKIKLAMDSASDIYQFALETLGVATKGVPPAAFPAMLALKAEALHSAKASSRPPILAQDAKGSKSFFERYPEAAKARVLG